MTEHCLCCGQPLHGQLPSHYCGLPCATLQCQTLGMLLHSTPRPALSLAEWHDLGSQYAVDLDVLAGMLKPAASPSVC